MAGNAEGRSGGRGSRWRFVIWGAAALMLLYPLVAMQVTDDVVWTAYDFAFMGALLGGVGLAFELAVRRTGDGAYRMAAALALAAVFLLVWINAAVGVIGSEDEGANLLYGGVLAVALAGAVFARFRAAGMAWAMGAAALAQALVPAIAWVLWPEVRGLVASPQLLGLTGLFAAMWLVSAWLFRRSAAHRTAG